MSAIPLRCDASDQRETHVNPEPASEFLPDRPLTIREGVLDDLATGEVFTISQADRPSARIIRRDRAEDPLATIAQTTPPTVRAQVPYEIGHTSMTLRTNRSAQSRERLLEEHRIRVGQLRTRYGDPNDAIDRLMTEAFDPAVMRRLAREFAREQLQVTDLEAEDDNDDGR